jgi:hypothetical protein
MRLWAALLLVGCASGRTSIADMDDSGTGGGTDTSTPQPDAPMIDAPKAADAAVDAKPIDAAIMIDAPPPMPDAPNATPDACSMMMSQRLTNPVLDVDASGTGWTQINIDNAYPIITADGFAAHTAPYKAWLGGWAGIDKGQASLTDQLYQDVMVPPATTMLRLTGQYAVGTQETTASVFDTAQLALVRTDGTPIQVILSLSNLTTTAGWLAIDVQIANPTALSGQTVRLRMTATNDITDASNFFFDSFALTATYCQ